MSLLYHWTYILHELEYFKIMFQCILRNNKKLFVYVLYTNLIITVLDTETYVSRSSKGHALNSYAYFISTNDMQII